MPSAYLRAQPGPRLGRAALTTRCSGRTLYVERVERVYMKTAVLGLIFLMASLAVYAQSTNAPTTNTVTAARLPPFELHAAGTGQLGVFTLRQPKPNQVFRGKLTYEGSVVEALKTRHPLQLLNPFAPAEYGSAEDNVFRNDINGQVKGLKLFAVRF